MARGYRCRGQAYARLGHHVPATSDYDETDRLGPEADNCGGVAYLSARTGHGSLGKRHHQPFTYQPADQNQLAMDIQASRQVLDPVTRRLQRMDECWPGVSRQCDLGRAAVQVERLVCIFAPIDQARPPANPAIGSQRVQNGKLTALPGYQGAAAAETISAMLIA